MMSFKRDGDDRFALNYQRKRRVTDLLYEDIHESELSRLSNGRFVCKTCPHGPIFDTINMFQVHRQGKKHQMGLVYHEEKAQELQNLMLKRRQEEEIKSEEKISNEVKIDTEPVYLKKVMNPYGRKITLELNNKNTQLKTNTTLIDELPGNKHNFQTKKAISVVRSQRHISHKEMNSNKVPSTTRSQGEAGTQYVTKPTTSTIGQSTLDKEKELNPKNLKVFIKQGGENPNKKFYFSRRQQDNSRKTQPNIQLNLEREHTVIEKHAGVSWERFKQLKGKHFVAPVHQRRLGRETISCLVHSNTNNLGDRDGEFNPMTRNDSTGPSIDNHWDNSHPDIAKQSNEGLPPTNDSQKRAREIINAYGAGWKRDWDGQWIRDEEAEFDSDEEPPSIT